MNCFIASAFDHDDVDAIYDHAILPVLKIQKLIPTRVDRVEHNDDIDDRIFTLINQSQLCIADLTHARPSVYYEAGYAFGIGKPVIYIARQDHLHPRENDPSGNLKVHFDLQMKNIIPWTKPNQTFRERLGSRIQHVLKPMRRQNRIIEKNRRDEERFTTLSQNERLAEILRKVQSLLWSQGYAGGGEPDDDGYYMRRDPFRADFHKTHRMTYRQIHISICPAITKTNVQNMHIQMRSLSKEEQSQFSRIESVCIIIALGGIRVTTLTNILPNWTPVKDKVFERHHMSDSRDAIPHSRTIAFIDGVKSLEEFTERFRKLTKELGVSK